jgi:hypothetical protein
LSVAALAPWSYTIGFGLMAMWIMGANIRSLLEAGQGSSSLILFLGGVFGALALLAAPPVFLKWFAWLPVVIDPGSGYAAWKMFRVK